MKAPFGAQLPTHHHTSTVMVYTIEGKWKYKWHDWVAGPGSIVYETVASTHTFEVVAEGGGGYAVTLVQVTGDLLFLDEKGNIVAFENWKTSPVVRYADESDPDLVDLRGRARNFKFIALPSSSQRVSSEAAASDVPRRLLPHM